MNGSGQHGGEIPSGGTLSATAPSGSVYYTIDGTDPRLQGGALAPGAILLDGNMTLPASGLVRMRARVGGGDSWSPLNEAVFYLERRATPADLRITEINYNALPPDAAEAVAGNNLTVPRAFSGDFEGVVCMYHDQANIARKLQPLETGATMFMGLPIVCGTTAHGTAFDKAGQGVANAQGLETALRWTIRLASAPRTVDRLEPTEGEP